MVDPWSPSADAAAPRSFPYRAVCILCMTQAVNAYAVANLFPYVGFMVKHLLDLGNNEVGYYAGFVASAYTFGGIISKYFWGSISDTYGRKAAMISGLSSIAVFSVAFGFSPSFSWAIVSRLLLGILNGIIPGVRPAIREVCGSKHVVLGMTLLGGATGIAMVVGAAVGGFLAKPAEFYPQAFSSTGLFARYPYLLPNLCGSCLAILVLPLLILCVPETKGLDQDVPTPPAKLSVEVGRSEDAAMIEQTASSPRGRLAVNNATGALREGMPERLTAGSPADDDDAHEAEGGAANTRQGWDDVSIIDGSQRVSGGHDADSLLSTPHVKALVAIGLVLQMVRLGYLEVYSLWALSTVDVGGLEWNTNQIGQVVGMVGIVMCVGQLVVFPALIHVFGIGNWSRLGCLLAVAGTLATPHVRSLSWNGASLVAATATTSALLNVGQGAVVIALTVGATSIVPSYKRGKLTGLCSTAESVGRFIGPAGYAVAYAWSISPSAPSWVDRRFVFYASAVTMAAVAILGWRTLTDEVLTKPAERKGGDAEAPAVPRRGLGDDEDDGQLLTSSDTAPRPGKREADMV